MYYGRHNSYRLNLVSAPGTEPVSLDDVKSYLGITDTSQDTIISDLITSTRQAMEDFLGMAFITQTWQVFYDRFPFNYFGYNCDYKPFQLPRSPLQSVDHIKYYNESEVETVVNVSNYYVRPYSSNDPFDGRVTFKRDFVAPFAHDLRPVDALEIQIIAGFGDNASDVPQVFKNAMFQEIGYRLDNSSGDVESETVNGVYSVKYSSANIVSGSGLSKSTQQILSTYKKIRI